MSDNNLQQGSIIVRSCNTCIHQYVCGAFINVSKMITNNVQFDVRVIALNAVYETLAKNCKEYKRG